MGYDYKKHIKPKAPKTARQLKQLEQAEAKLEQDKFTQAKPDTWIPDKQTQLTQPAEYYVVLARIASGMTVKQACNWKELPTPGQLQYAVRIDDKFKREYDRAIELQADTYFDDIIRIADNLDKRGVYCKITEDGRTAEMEHVKQVDRDRLMISARQWVLGRRFPKLYGEYSRQEITNDLSNIKPVINIIKHE